MEKKQPKDRDEVDDEPLRDEELENVSGGNTGDWQSNPNGFPDRRRRPQPPGAQSGMIGDLS